MDMEYTKEELVQLLNGLKDGNIVQVQIVKEDKEESDGE